MASSSILTGQFVRINQTPASVGERLLAQLIDWAIQGAYFSGLLYLYVEVLDNFLGFSSALQVIFIIFGIILPTVFYGFLFELFGNGQTIGKRIMKMRVVKTDGSLPGIGSYLMRWMFMLIDGPLLSGMGVIVMLINKDNRRFGDLAAGTMVIKQGIYRRLQVSLEEFEPFSRNYRPTYPAAENLSLEQVSLIDQTLRLKENDQRIHALAEHFLWHVKRDYQYYALEEI